MSSAIGMAFLRRKSCTELDRADRNRMDTEEGEVELGLNAAMGVVRCCTAKAKEVHRGFLVLEGIY